MATIPFSFAELGERSSDHEGGDVFDQEERRDTEPIKYCSHLKDFSSFEPVQEEPEPDPLFTAEDLALAVDEARRVTASETEAELRLAMANDIDQRRCNMLATIRDQIEWHKSTFEQELVRSADVSHQLALALVKAVIPKAIEQCPLIDISDVLKSTLARLVEEPSIELRLPSDLADCGENLITDLARDVGLAGEVKVIADPALSDGDMTLRWKGGAIDRRLDRLQDEASHLVNCWLHEGLPASRDDVVETSFVTSESEASVDRPMSSDKAESADEGGMP